MKIYISSLLLLPLGLLLLFISCDKVKPPFTKPVTIDTTSVKRVLCEEGTATPCPNCPQGICTIEQMSAQYSNNFIPIAYHWDGLGTDPMYNSLFEPYFGRFLNNLGIPCITLNRKRNPDNNQPVDYATVVGEFSTALTTPSPVDLSIINVSWNSSSRVLTFNIQAKVKTAFSGNYSFNNVLTEDSVHGTDATWAQDDHWAGGGNGVMCGFESYPSSPVPASEMYYNHVARAIQLNWWTGDPDSNIPVNNNVGATIESNPYSYTLPAGYNAAQVNIVGFMINLADSTIVNACQAVHVGK